MNIRKILGFATIIKSVKVAIAIIIGAILGMFLLEGIILHSYLWGIAIGLVIALQVIE